MTRILFVDDDLRFLEALRVGLLPRADTWGMTFVESGARALEELERAPHDVLVADVRMPGMDGAQLLRTVRERWPDTVRIVLSGAADLGDVVRLLPVAHQYLSKPCLARQLEEVIERSLDLKAILRNRYCGHCWGAPTGCQHNHASSRDCRWPWPTRRSAPGR